MNRDSSQQHPWPTTTIAESSYLRGRIGWQGLKAAEFRHEGPYLVTGTDFRPGKIEWDTCYHVSEARFAEAEYIHLRNGDLLVTKDGTIGKIAYVEGCPEKAVLNSGIFVLRCRDGSYDHRYMFYVLQSDYFRRFLDDNLAGSTIQHLYQHVFEGFEFPLPEKTEQFKITKILSTVDRAIEQTEALISKHQRIKTGLMQDLLTRGIGEHGNLRSEQTHPFKDSLLGRIPANWEVRQLYDLAQVDRGKFTHRPRNDPRFYGGEYPFIQTGDVTARTGRIVCSYTQTLSKHGVQVSKRFPSGTIAITIAANIGDTAILGIPMFFPDSVVGVRVRAPHSTRFIEMALRRWKPALETMAPKSAQRNINLEVLRPLLIATSPPDEQDKIAAVYEHADRLHQQYEDSQSKLYSLKTSLMQDLLTGKRQATSFC